MAKKKFNSNLIIEYRNKVGYSQSELANYLSDISKAKNLSVSISMRTIRELESGKPIDEVKGLFIFNHIGYDYGPEIYDESEEVPTIKPIDYKSAKDFHIVPEVSLRYGTQQECIWDLVRDSQYYYFYFGDLDPELTDSINTLIYLLGQKGKTSIFSPLGSTSKGEISRELWRDPNKYFETKLEENKVLKNLENANIKIFATHVYDKFSYFKPVSLEYYEHKLDSISDDIYLNKIEAGNIPFRDIFQIVDAGPEVLTIIGIVSDNDPGIRNEFLWKGGILQSTLLVSKNFEEKELFGIDIDGIDLLDKREESKVSDIRYIPSESFERRYPNQEKNGIYMNLEFLNTIYENQEVMNVDGKFFVKITTSSVKDFSEKKKKYESIKNYADKYAESFVKIGKKIDDVIIDDSDGILEVVIPDQEDNNGNPKIITYTDK